MPMINSALRAPGSVPGAAGRRRRFFGRRALTAWATVAVALATSVAVASPAQARNPMYIGSVAGGYQQMQSGTREQVANHQYSRFSSNVPQGRMITVNAGSASWSSVANAGPGTALYNDIVRWAQTIKGRSGPVMLAYNHEPEASAGGQHGTPSEFIAAWRHVVTIFRNQGVQNVEWTWQMTAWAFRTSPSDPAYAAKWYPGDAYVDIVGADAYNWYNCGHGRGKYNELSVLGAPVLSFARAHGKAAAFPEFASDAGANRVQWIRNAHQYLLNNQDILFAAFYFNRPPTVAANGDCQWALNTQAEYDAFGDIVRDPHFTT